MAEPPVARSGRYPRAYPLFFLLACLYGAAAVPLWAAEWSGGIAGCQECAPALRHGHEMVQGYAGAIIAGYLLTKVTGGQLALAVASWGLGRAAAWGEWGGLAGTAAGLAFPVMLFILAGLPFWRAARSPRNMVFAPLIAGFTAAEGLSLAGFPRGGVLLAFDLIAMLILVMGGRLIPAAMAGLVRREEGAQLFDRNRPWLEWVCVAGLAVAGMVHAIGLSEAVAAAGHAAAAVAALLRHSRWRFRLALRDPSLGPLQLGYGALAAGLAATAIAVWTDVPPPAAALHLAAIAGFGVVTTTMMLRTVAIRERSGPFPRMAWPVAFLLLAAAVLRVAMAADPAQLLPAAAALWSIALLVTALAIVRVVRWRF